MAYVWLILAQSAVGINIVGSKFLLDQVSVLFLLMARFWLAAVFLFILHAIRPRRQQPALSNIPSFNRRDLFYLIFQALCAGALFNLLLLTGLQYTSASVAGIITSALPAMITIFSLIILRERLTQQGILCVLLAVIGLVVINWHGLNVSGRVHLKGPMIIMLALLPESLYYVLCKIHRVNLPIFLLAGWINLINGVVVLPLALWHPEIWPSHLSSFTWLILAAVGLSTALFYVFWTLGCLRVSGSLAGLFTAVMPIATLILSWAFLSEGISLLQALGMLLVISSIVLYARQ